MAVADIEVLPNELVISIICLTSGRDILRNVHLVSKRWNYLSNSELVWQTRCILEKELSFKIYGITWRSLYLFDTSGVCKHLNNMANLSKIASFLSKEWIHKDTKCHGDKLLQKSNACPCTFNYLWLCVEGDCFNVGCGRRDNIHALGHCNATGHGLTLKLNTFEMWCYGCERWIGQEESNIIEAARLLEIQNKLHKACNSVPQKSVVERRQKERNFVQAKKGDARWAVAAIGWIKKWERFIIGDLPEFSERIDNTPLLDHSGRAVRRGLTREDYRVFSMPAWEMIVKQYGGGPLVAYDWQHHRWTVDLAE